MGNPPATIIIARYFSFASITSFYTNFIGTGLVSMPRTKTGISPRPLPTTLLSPMAAGCNLVRWVLALSTCSITATSPVLRIRAAIRPIITLLVRIAVPQMSLRIPVADRPPSQRRQQPPPLAPPKTCPGESAEPSFIPLRTCDVSRRP